jgi:hypothetical protein
MAIKLLLQKWEYKSVGLDVHRSWFGSGFSAEKFQVYLNTLGEEGWDLVSIIDLNAGREGSVAIIVTSKRPRWTSIRDETLHP